MKKDFFSRPEGITERRCRDYGGFSWLEFLTAIPEPVFVVTGWKANGKANACLQSWSTFASAGVEDFVCLLGSVNPGGHLYPSLKRTGACVINFASGGVLERCVRTIGNNGWETDEIAAAGLTAEKAVKVDAPRIKECFLNIECVFLWEHALCGEGGPMTVALKAVGASMDGDLYEPGRPGRYGKTGYPLHLHCPVHPETGEDAPGGIGAVELDSSFVWDSR